MNHEDGSIGPNHSCAEVLRQRAAIPSSTEERARRMARDWLTEMYLKPSDPIDHADRLVSRLAPLLGEVERLKAGNQRLIDLHVKAETAMGAQVATLTRERHEAQAEADHWRNTSESYAVVVEGALKILGAKTVDIEVAVTEERTARQKAESERDRILTVIEAFPESALHTVHEQVWKRNLQIAIRAALSEEPAPGKEPDYPMHSDHLPWPAPAPAREEPKP